MNSRLHHGTIACIRDRYSCSAFVFRRLQCRTPNGIRTRAATLKGWCPRPLDDGGLRQWPLLVESDQNLAGALVAIHRPIAKLGAARSAGACRTGRRRDGDAPGARRRAGRVSPRVGSRTSRRVGGSIRRARARTRRRTASRRRRPGRAPRGRREWNPTHIPSITIDANITGNQSLRSKRPPSGDVMAPVQASPDAVHDESVGRRGDRLHQHERHERGQERPTEWSRGQQYARAADVDDRPLRRRGVSRRRPRVLRRASRPSRRVRGRRRRATRAGPPRCTAIGSSSGEPASASRTNDAA